MLRNLAYGLLIYIDTRTRWKLYAHWLLALALFTFLAAVIVIASMIGAWVWLVWGPGPG